MEDNIIIRPTKTDDALAIRTAYCEACRTTYDGIIPPDVFEKVTTLNTEDIIKIENEIKVGEPEYYVAEINGKVAGYISLTYPKVGDYPEVGDKEEQEKSFEIEHLYINPAYQKRGIGFALLDKVCREKRKIGYKNLIVQTVNNGISYKGIPYKGPSLEFYRQLGIIKIIREELGMTLKVSCVFLTRELDKKYEKLTFSEANAILKDKTPEEQDLLIKSRYNIRQALKSAKKNNS